MQIMSSIPHNNVNQLLCVNFLSQQNKIEADQLSIYVTVQLENERYHITGFVQTILTCFQNFSSVGLG